MMSVISNIQINQWTWQYGVQVQLPDESIVSARTSESGGYKPEQQRKEILPADTARE